MKHVDALIRYQLPAGAVFDDAWFVSNMAKQGEPTRKSICHFTPTHFVVSGGHHYLRDKERKISHNKHLS